MNSIDDSPARPAMRALENLCRDFWGKPAAYHTTFLFNEESISYTSIDLKNHAMELNSLGFFVPNQLLIRREYRETYESFSRAFDHEYPPSFSLQGQPGIGKTLFILYILLHRMSLGLATALHIQAGNYFLIDGNNISVHNHLDPTPLKQYPGIWCLSVSSEVIKQPAPAFLGALTRIIGMSPRGSCWGGWVSKSGGIMNFMDVWSCNELASLAHAVFGPDKVSEMIELASQWGPATDDLVRLIRYPELEEQHLRSITIAANRFVREPVAVLVCSCSPVLWFRPSDRVNAYGTHNTAIPWVPDAPKITSALRSAIRELSVAEQAAFFRECRTFSSTGTRTLELEERLM